MEDAASELALLELGDTGALTEILLVANIARIDPDR